MNHPLLTAALLCLALPPTAVAGEASASQVLAADTPSTTKRGNTFAAPKEWALKRAARRPC